MLKNVFSGRKDNKIVNSIVGLVSIYMMDVFISFKKSAMFFLHYKSVLCNICSGFFTRVVRWVINKNVPLRTSMSSSFPEKAILSFYSFIPRICSFSNSWMNAFRPSSRWKFFSYSEIANVVGGCIKYFSDLFVRELFLVKKIFEFFNRYFACSHVDRIPHGKYKCQVLAITHPS